jgi:hypothetical protein
MTETVTTTGITDSSLSVLLETTSHWFELTEMQVFFVAMLFLFITLLFLTHFSLNQKKNGSIKKDLNKLKKDLLIANSTTIGMGQKIMDIEKKLLYREQTSQLSGVNNGINKDDRDSRVNSSPKDVNSDARENGRVGEEFTVSNEHYVNDLASNQHYKKPAKVTNRSMGSKINNSASLSLVNNKFLHNDELPSDAVYEKSRLLLSQGVDINDVVKQSGLSFSEVSLMQKLAK